MQLGWSRKSPRLYGFDGKIQKSSTVAKYVLAVTLGLGACGSQLSPQLSPAAVFQAPSSCARNPQTLGDIEKMKPFFKLNGCGISRPWKVASLNGVRFSHPATVDCHVAETMHEWLEAVAQPAARQVFNEPIASLKVAASYSCRSRNNQPGAKISEHGRGNAIDISGFTLKSGRQISVLEGWNDAGRGEQFLTTVHKRSCGPFKTVLGPESDKYHRDHFHFDLAKRRNDYAFCQ